MKWLLVFSLSFVIFLSCNNQRGNKFQSVDNVLSVDGGDVQMNAAIEIAKATFSQFDTAFKNGHIDASQFSIKVRFETQEGAEHIWTDSLTFENGAYSGIVDADAVAANNVKQGDRVKITLDNLSDWMYNDDGILRGGFTIKALRNRMSADEKAKFDSSFYLKIVD